ncbi:MAG: YbjN domain-containing protein [Sphingobacteriia bacterium]|jgi:hypothetical protein
MIDFRPYYDMVEACIQDLGVQPANCRGEKTGQYNLNKGSASVWIDFFERDGRGYYQVVSPVVAVPDEGADTLFRELLQINDTLYGVAFTLYNDWVWLKVIREVDGMDKPEAMAMLLRVGNYADHYDDYLRQRYAFSTDAKPTKPGVPGGA